MTMHEEPSHGSPPTLQAPRVRRLRTALPALAIVAALVIGWTQPVAAQTSSEPGLNAFTCVTETELTKLTTTGGPFDGGTTITWNVISPCPQVTVSINGAVVDRNGSMVVDPVQTSQYTLVAKMGVLALPLGSTIALGGDIIGYEVWYGHPLKQPNPTTPEADAARLIAGEITGALSKDAKLELVGKTLEIHIIPAETPLTLLPPWRGLRGTMTCEAELPDGKPNEACVDPRPWRDVRGAGGTLASATRIATAAGQETLVDVPNNPPATYRLGHVLAHELGHTVLDFATPNEKVNVANVLANNDPTHVYMGKGDYTKSTPHEYFAEGTAGLFEYPRGSGSRVRREFTPAWLMANEPNLYTILSRVFPGAT